MIERRAAILCRVSTIQQDNRRQTEELLNMAIRGGFVVDEDDIYEDTISGFSKMETRKSLSRLLHNIESGLKKYDLVYCWEVSRISRDPDEGQKILLKFSELNLPIYIKTLNLFTHQEGEFDRHGKLKKNPLFKLVFTLMSEFAASEAEYIRERSISGQRSKIKNGHAGGGVMLAYGYSRDENKMLVIDPIESIVIKDIYGYALNGMGLKHICRILNDSGVPTKSQKVLSKGTIVTKGSGTSKLIKETKHIRWEEGTVQKILTNPLYKGERKYKVGEKQKDGVNVPVYETFLAPIIIDPALFDKVQVLRTEKFNKNIVEMRYLYLLKGICICGVCGRNYYGRYKPGGKDMFYQCSSRRHSHLVCGNTGVNIEAIESTVWDAIRTSSYAYKQLTQSGDKALNVQNKIDGLKSEIQTHNLDIYNAELAKEKMKTMFIKDVINEDEMLAENENIKKLIALKSNIIKRLDTQIVSLKRQSELLNKLNTFVSLLKEVEKDRYQISILLNNILEKVVVTSVSKLRNNYKYIISIFIKDLEVPLSLLLITKQRNQPGETEFIKSQLIERSGQNRFKYVEGGFSYQIEYDQNGLLQTDVDDVIEFIEDFASSDRAEYDLNKNLQLFSAGSTLNFDEQPVDVNGNWDHPIILEHVPNLLIFEEKNEIERVKKLNKNKKR